MDPKELHVTDKKFIYVLVATVEGARVPLAIFNNRSRCEVAAQTELEAKLKANGLRMYDCNHFTVEEWFLNAWLDSKSIKTLTSYDNRGEVARVLVPQGLEGKTTTEKKGSRFRKIMETTDE